MPVRYQHTQKGGFWFYVAVIVFPLIYLFMLVSAINRQILDAEKIAFIVLPIFGGFLVLMMSGLTVTIDDLSIQIRFGSGVFWKTYSLTKITDCRQVRNGWWWGYGVRWYIEGWLYNIAGMDAVEITFNNSKKIRIGTDEPEKLALAIKEAIK